MTLEQFIAANPTDKRVIALNKIAGKYGRLLGELMRAAEAA